MMSCKEAARRMSQQLDRQLSVPERIGLSLHLLMCQGCRNFRDNMAFLRRACDQLSGRESPRTDAGISNRHKK